MIYYRSALLISFSLGSLAIAGSGASTNLATIEMQRAILSTNDGKKAAADLRASFQSDESRLQKQQSDLESDKDLLNRKRRLAWLPVRHKMIASQRKKLLARIDEQTKLLDRDTRRVTTMVEQEQLRKLNELARRMHTAIGQYAKANGYSIIVDKSAALTSSTDVTAEVIALYDRLFPTAP